MYESFYGLKDKPFSLLPDPSFLYLGRPHSAAYAVLEYGVLSQAGLTVITGEVGCGKTTLIRHLLNRLDPHVTVGLISNTGNLTGDLLRWILFAFRQDYRQKGAVELHEVFEDFLIAEYGSGRRTVLVVDEAQNLSIATLEELRMLSNINSDKDLLLQIVLVGQPELKQKTERPELQQFAQRISTSYHLGPLSEEETVAYVHHRLTCAGATRPIFTPAACVAVHAQSGGVPRLINALCDIALVYGYAEGVAEIGLDIVHSVIRDRSKGIQPSNPQARKLVPIVPPLPQAGEATAFNRELAKQLFWTLRKD
jgi:type II secretory pathway predicted ATPase ExeA